MKTFPFCSYRPEIDGLRALAVLFVVGSHALPEWVKAGYIGVDVFFVISGFLITNIIVDSLENKTFYLIQFYKRRITRIFPALLIMMTTVGLLGWYVLLPGEYHQLCKHIAGAAGFLSHYILWNESGCFDNELKTKPLVHLWSLGIEEQFYLVWPIFLFFIWKISKKKNLNQRLFLISVFSLMGILAFFSFLINFKTVSDDIDFAFYSPLSRAWELLIGGMLSIYIRVYPQVRFYNFKAFVGFSLISIALFSFNASTPFPGAAALLPTLGTGFILQAGSRAWINRIILCFPLLRRIGAISYSLYLWHWPILCFFVHILNRPPQPKLFIFTLIGISFVLSWITDCYVEKPVRLSQKHQLFLTILMIAIGLAALFQYKINKNHDFIEKPYQAIRRGSCYLENPQQDQHAPECIEKTRPLFMLWGDSHAASLYPGLLNLQKRYSFGIAQLTQYNCAPLLQSFNQKRKNCEQINQQILKTAKELKPEVIFLHSNWISLLSENENLLEQTVFEIEKQLPDTLILVLGPTPSWKRPLERSLLKKNESQYSSINLLSTSSYLERWIMIRGFGSSGLKGAEYISTQNILCNDSGCLTQTGKSTEEWSTIGTDHLSEAGATFLMEKIFSVYLKNMLTFLYGKNKLYAIPLHGEY